MLLILVGTLSAFLSNVGTNSYLTHCWCHIPEDNEIRNLRAPLGR